MARRRRQVRMGRVLFVFVCLIGVIMALIIGGLKACKTLQPELLPEEYEDVTAENYERAHDKEIAQIKSGHALDTVSVTGFSDAELRSLFYSSPLDEDQISKMYGVTYSDQQDFITTDDLRYVRVLYRDFKGNTCIGELIVNQAISTDIENIFYDLYTHQYEIDRMVLPEAYKGDESTSMSADNTTGFNFYLNSGIIQNVWSMGYGVYINPLYNPRVVLSDDEDAAISEALPNSGLIYADRSVMKDHMIDKNDYAYQVFTSYGFSWGGDDSPAASYGMFYKNFPRQTTAANIDSTNSADSADADTADSADTGDASQEDTIQYDPYTGYPIESETDTDTQQEETIQYDPYTGLPVDNTQTDTTQEDTVQYDPYTGLPVDIDTQTSGNTGDAGDDQSTDQTAGYWCDYYGCYTY